jgi:hypothetical protein
LGCNARHAADDSRCLASEHAADGNSRDFDGVKQIDIQNLIVVVHIIIVPEAIVRLHR